MEREREGESLTRRRKERESDVVYDTDEKQTLSPKTYGGVVHLQDADPVTEVETYMSYPQRHLVLLLYGTITCLNSAIWVAYSAIISTATTTYHVPETTLSYLTVPYLLSAIFLLPLGSYIVDKEGIRTAVLLGGGVTMCGSWIRYLSGTFASPHVRFGVLMLGQCVASAGLPVLHPIPPRLAVVWYPPHERTVATGGRLSDSLLSFSSFSFSLFISRLRSQTHSPPYIESLTLSHLPFPAPPTLPSGISSVSQVIGIAVGYGLSIALVGGSSDCCGHLNLTLSILVTVPTLLSIFLFSPVPPSPPSPAAMTVRTHFMESVKFSLKRSGYVVLLCTLSPGLGVLNSMFAFMGVFTSGKGYDDEVSGLIGVVLVMVGLIGAVIFGAIADRTKLYVKLCRISFLLSAVTSILFVCAIQFRLPPYAVLLFAALFGFFLLSLLPLCLEFAVEVTYPAAEGVVTGTIMWIGNIYGLASFFFTNALIVNGADGQTESSVALWFNMFGMVCCGVGGAFLHGSMRRRREERRMEGKGEEGEEE